MPTQEEIARIQEKIFAEICQLVEEAAKPARCARGMHRALHRLYYCWIVSPGINADGTAAPCPWEVWDQPKGDNLRRQFQKIGRKAGAKANGKEVAEEDTLVSALETEADSQSDAPCEWCQPPPG